MKLLKYVLSGKTMLLNLGKQDMSYFIKLCLHFHIKLKKLKSYFVDNGYHSTVFFKITKESLSRIKKCTIILNVSKLTLLFKFSYFVFKPINENLTKKR